MNDYKKRIKNCIDYLNSIRFPCEDWKEDKIYFDQLEKEFSEEATDKETHLLVSLQALVYRFRRVRQSAFRMQ